MTMKMTTVINLIACHIDNTHAVKHQFINATVLNICSDTALQPNTQLTEMQKTDELCGQNKSGENISAGFTLMPLHLEAIFW